MPSGRMHDHARRLVDHHQKIILIEDLQRDILRARKNEELASKYGLQAQIEDPLDKNPISMRDFLKWTLAEVNTLAELLGLTDDLIPLYEMASGGPNQAERYRDQICAELGQNINNYGLI